MRTAYLGTSEFASAVLRRLADSPHRPALVVAPPDRKRGRGRAMSPPPVAETARELGLELLQSGDVNQEATVARIRESGPEALAVCAFGQLIREPLLSDHPILNVHPSLLPRWRGAAPIERAIMAGDAVTGVSIMRLTEGLDSGPVALAGEVPIGPREGYAGLAPQLAELGGELLVRGFDSLAEGELDFVEQDDAAATYAEKISAQEGRLAPARPAAELERVVRALNPHVGTFVELDGGGRLGIRAASALAEGPEAGSFAESDGALLLGCGEGALSLELVQPPGGRPMQARDFLRGHALPSRAL
ncbi:MAG: methionyl-tRNA formyltransferase [Solirubrobacterales bacterium]|nr:methionyl-tRNA formyltransferase [Solirubrobacterales bacterium]